MPQSKHLEQPELLAHRDNFSYILTSVFESSAVLSVSMHYTENKEKHYG